MIHFFYLCCVINYIFYYPLFPLILVLLCSHSLLFFLEYVDKYNPFNNLTLGEENSIPDEGNVVIGVLVFACNRVTVKRNLDQLLK